MLLGNFSVVVAMALFLWQNIFHAEQNSNAIKRQQSATNYK